MLLTALAVACLIGCSLPGRGHDGRAVAVRSVHGASSPSKSATPPVRRRLYWGAWIGAHLTGGEAPWDRKAVPAFEQHAGHKLSLVEFSTPFLDCRAECTWVYFPTSQFTDIRAHGAIPFFSWSSASIPISPTQPALQMADLASGTFDEHIRRWARSARQWGHPFFLRFDWEMNTTDFPWSYRSNGNSARTYVAAWRHVHRVFQDEGATNATWVWCPNADPTLDVKHLASLYPGDAYVDWTCLDVYNFNRPWRSFSRLVGPYYREITRTIAPDKPMAIGETATVEQSGSKPRWITDMLRVLPRLPKIRAVIYFDVYTDRRDWPIESSSAAQEAFRTGIGTGPYVGNAYRHLRASPIKPP